MADRQIYCSGCKRYLGLIRDANLRKNIHYLCDNCETKRLASDLAKKAKPNDFGDIFGGIFK